MDDFILKKVNAMMRKQGQFDGIEDSNEFEDAPEDSLLRQKIWDEGDHIEGYPCDVNSEGETESNGSLEHRIEYEGKIYLLHTDFGESEIYNF